MTFSTDRDLLYKLNPTTFFQSKLFLEPWLEVFNPNLQIATYETAEELELVIPFIQTQHQLELLGSDETFDYREIYWKKASSLQYLPQLTSELKQTKFEIVLPSVREASPLLDQELNSKEPETICPIITLPKSWEAYLSSLKRKHRHELRRKMRKIVTQSTASYRTATAETIQADIQHFKRLHTLSSSEKKAFWTPQLERFFEQLILNAQSQGVVRLFFVEIEQQPIATILIFNWDNQYLVYNSGFDPNYASLSAGNAIIGWSIQQAIQEGCTHYNFLRGDEDYKFKFGVETEQLYRLRL